MHKLNCPKCSAELEIKVNKLPVQGVPETELALCPKCGAKLMEQKMDGWFFVSAVSDRKSEKLCVDPMP